ncbi:MAG TPA: phosphoribosylglycinamide formyltransferase [Gemmatimonadota bacterium]
MTRSVQYSPSSRRSGAGGIRIAVFASGRGSNLEALFETLAGRSDATIVLVCSDRPGAQALERARARGVEAVVLAPEDEGAMLGALERARVDWIVLAGYLKRVPSGVVRRYRNRILNVHPALLPAHGGVGMYGERVHRAVIEAGEATSGASVHLVDEEYDRGPVVAQESVAVLPGDTPATLAARVLEVEHRLLPAAVVAAAEGRIRIEEGRAWIEAEAR